MLRAATMLVFTGLTGSLSAAQERVHWRATLEVTPEGKELPFGLELERGETEWKAYLLNPPERIEVPHVEWDGERLLLDIPHYQSRITATRDANGELVGEWTKVRGKDRTARVVFRARPVAADEPGVATDPGAPGKFVAGRWSVKFADDALPAVAVLDQQMGTATVTGTILTATGDYRYLAGEVEGNTLRLSCFDGAHAFLFEAELADDGTLAGVFHSGNWWRDTWTAERNAEAKLGDAFQQTAWNGRMSLSDFAFPDLAGVERSLVDLAFPGKITLVQLFGSWCPNCHDETAYLVELHERYAERGLRILGLAFELTGDSDADSEQVRIFARRYGIEYPLFLAGTADKADATLAFPAIDRLRSFPTTIFLDKAGRVRSVHSGFAGPATGAEHTQLRAEFEREIEALLDEESTGEQDLWRALTRTSWTALDGTTYEFSNDEDRARSARRSGEQDLTVRIVGDAVWMEQDLWRMDFEAGVLLAPQNIGGRLYPSDGSATPMLDKLGTRSREAIQASLKSEDALVRRESLVALSQLGHTLSDGAAVAPLVEDEDLAVRATAFWVAADIRLESVAESIFAALAHPNARLRKEATRSLRRLWANDADKLQRLP